MKIKRDVNGNKVLLLEKSDIGCRGFSIQTLGNLPLTHRDGIGSWSYEEALQYVKQCGTKYQRQAMGV